MKTIMFDLAMPDHFDITNDLAAVVWWLSQMASSFISRFIKLRTGLATSDRITFRSTGRTGKSLTGPRSKGSAA
jgi:hypothetical protein